MRNTPMRSAQSGFTLIEAVIVFVLIGIITAYAYPRLASGSARNNVRSARGHIISLFAKTRAAAIETGRRTTLNFNASSAWITATPRLTVGGAGTMDTIGAQVDNLTTRYGVTVTWAPASQLVVDPRGFGATATTVWVTRQGFTDSMVVSGFGRVIK
jgi:prepilin-type N-terminal cleavage/methylation domain-containing protein